MKMPWYSMYNPDSPQRSRFRQQSRASNPSTSNVFSHTVHYSSPSFSTPSFRQQSHYASYPPPPSARRHYPHDFSHFRSDSSAYNSSSRARHSSPSSSSSSTGASPFKSRSDGSTWYHHRRTVDSATERLLARADALTERLHRLLAKSADLHWRRMDHPVRPDIFNRMSQSNAPSTATGTSSTTTRAANMASPSATDTAASSVKVDDITVSKTEPRPTTRTHVITIKLSNSYSNRGNHRTQHQPQEPQKPQNPQTPQEPQKPQEPQESREQQQSRENYYQHRHQQSPQSHHSSRPYRPSTTRKPPVVRIIPIQIEVESDDSGVVIDPERDIQVPDDDPRVPIVRSPSPSRRNMSQDFVNVPVTVVEVSAMPKPTVDSDLDTETDLESEASIRSASGGACSRRWALTMSLAEEKKAEGNAYYKAKDYRKALVCYTRAIELCPESVAYYGNRAACRMMMGLYQDALEDARESTRLDTGFAKGYVRIAKCCLALGDTAAALNAINKAEELDPRSDLANEKQSLQILQQLSDEIDKSNAKGDYRKVIYCCDRSLQHAPAARRLKLTKAECLALLGRYAEAEEMANDILRLDQTNADALLVRGLCFYYQDNIDRAFLHFKQVLLMAPDHVKARDSYRRAKLLKAKKEEGNEAFKAGRYQEAHDLYTATLNIDHNNKLTNAKVYFNRAVVLVKLNKLKEALGDCNRAIELDETYMKAYLRRAKINMDLEQFEDAVRDYEKINKMDKNRDYKRLLHEAKLALKKSQRKDYYKILGVDRNANDEEIKKAYKKRALVHHPDRHSSASEEEKKEQEKKFKELGEAYGILSDPKKKSRYDNGHDIEDVDNGYSSEMDPNQIFQAFFGGPGMFRMGNMGGGMGGMGGAGMGGHCPGSFNFQFG